MHKQVAEAEFAFQILAQFVNQGLGVLHHKADSELIRHAVHAFLCGLEYEWHQRVILTYQLAELDSGVESFLAGGLPAVHHEAHIGDNAEYVGLVFQVEFDRIVVVGRHQQFRPGTLSPDHLLLVESVANRAGILLKHKFIQSRQIC